MKVFLEQENKLKKRSWKIRIKLNVLRTRKWNLMKYTCFLKKSWSLLNRAFRAISSAFFGKVGVDFLQLRSKVRMDLYTGLKYKLKDQANVICFTIFLSNRSIPVFEMWWQSTSSSWRRFGQFSSNRRDVSVKRGQLSRSISSRLWRISPLHKWRIPSSVIDSQWDNVNSKTVLNKAAF